MAKRRASIDPNLFAKTEGEPSQTPEESIPADGYTRPISVGMKESELAILDDIAQQEGIARNAVMRYFLRWAMAEYQAGRLTIPVTETRARKIDMP